jgi:hypothetical protein
MKGYGRKLGHFPKDEERRIDAEKSIVKRARTGRVDIYFNRLI